MIDFEYAGRHVRGVWRMAQGDHAWAEDIDSSTDGVFKSFWAIAFAAPFALLVIRAAQRATARADGYGAEIFEQIPALAAFVALMLAFLTSWLASVAALAFIARGLNAQRKAGALIVTFNWSQLIAIAAATVPAVVLALTGNEQIVMLLALPAVFVSVYVLWGVLRRNLPITVGVAIAVMALLAFIDLGVNAVATQGAVGLFHLLS